VQVPTSPVVEFTIERLQAAGARLEAPPGSPPLGHARLRVTGICLMQPAPQILRLVASFSDGASLWVHTASGPRVSRDTEHQAEDSGWEGDQQGGDMTAGEPTRLCCDCAGARRAPGGLCAHALALPACLLAMPVDALPIMHMSLLDHGFMAAPSAGPLPLMAGLREAMKTTAITVDSPTALLKMTLLAAKGIRRQLAERHAQGVGERVWLRAGQLQAAMYGEEMVLTPGANTLSCCVRPLRPDQEDDDEDEYAAVGQETSILHPLALAMLANAVAAPASVMSSQASSAADAPGYLASLVLHLCLTSGQWRHFLPQLEAALDVFRRVRDPAFRCTLNLAYLCETDACACASESTHGCVLCASVVSVVCVGDPSLQDAPADCETSSSFPEH
jgi:hypothetical protein